MKRIILSTMTAGLLTITLCQCKSTQVTVDNAGVVKTETLSQTTNAIHDVIYGRWYPTTVGTVSVEATGIDRPYIEFGQNDTNHYLVNCYAYNGCNYINGTYAITPGGEMKPTGELATTMKMCDDAPYEMGFTLALNTVTGYKLEKKGDSYLLQLIDANGHTTMTLCKYDSAAIDGAWQIASVANNKIHASGDSYQLVIDLTQGKIHGNVGCNVVNGTVTTNLQLQNSISFSDLRTTRMTCPDIQTEQQILAALESVTSVELTDNNKTAHLKDATGTTILTLHRI